MRLATRTLVSLPHTHTLMHSIITIISNIECTVTHYRSLVHSRLSFLEVQPLISRFRYVKLLFFFGASFFCIQAGFQNGKTQAAFVFDHPPLLTAMRSRTCIYAIRYTISRFTQALCVRNAYLVKSLVKLQNWISKAQPSLDFLP